MAKYRKKPIVVDAWKFRDNKNCFDALKEIDVLIKYDYQHNPNPCYIETLEGNMYLTDGDWIIRDVKGEFYPIKANIFKETYEKID